MLNKRGRRKKAFGNKWPFILSLEVKENKGLNEPAVSSGGGGGERRKS